MRVDMIGGPKDGDRHEPRSYALYYKSSDEGLAHKYMPTVEGERVWFKYMGQVDRADVKGRPVLPLLVGARQL